MGSFRFDRLLEIVASIDLFMSLLWLGLAVLSVTLSCLILTRWGQSHILRKCLMLSLLAHFLLAGYATTVSIMTSIPDAPSELVMKVTLADTSKEAGRDMVDGYKQDKPWEAFLHDAVSQPELTGPERVEAQKTDQPKRRPSPNETPLIDASVPEQLAVTGSKRPDPKLPKREVSRKTGANNSPQPILVPQAQRRDEETSLVPMRKMPQKDVVGGKLQELLHRTENVGAPTALLESTALLPSIMATDAMPEPDMALIGETDMLLKKSRGKLAKIGGQKTKSGAAVNALAIGSGEDEGVSVRPLSQSPGGSKEKGGIDSSGPEFIVGKLVKIGPSELPRMVDGDQRHIPEIYKLRTVPDRSKKARANGANVESEAAVKAALKWLADNQESDGRWDAQRSGAGKEAMIDGQSRHNAGLHADAGVTGLAILAFLASGHTHLDGQYQENVRLGLSYLILLQGNDGRLSGNATPYAAMYCHAMAAFALSEALAMTGDERLEVPVRRAIQYTVDAQDGGTGGWRYRPGDPGDTSQFGWQVMALKSAEIAGIRIPSGTKLGMGRFLQAVSSGRYGGLAAYRKNYRPTPPMTAEALVCRLFLGISPDEMASREAADFLLGQMPGEGKPNFYYWYYATLAMYQLQGTHWQRWNESLQKNLVDLQQRGGRDAGSWAPETVWGNYGGRVYSTAMATLCLEVYYRFLPLYVEAAALKNRVR